MVYLHLLVKFDTELLEFRKVIVIFDTFTYNCLWF